MWEVSHGDKPEELLLMLRESDQFRDNPEDLVRPDLIRGLPFIYNAFWIVGSERNLENGPIPFSAMDRFARRYRISGDPFERFRILVTRMDNAYRQRMSSIQAKVIEEARSNPPEPRKQIPRTL